ncbi:hypothetical protein TGVAND_435830 [Toxoplasma gondii VAND]|uniref:Uncharacterized protein n=1 Tax=Toxoplasma gondii VAND TaxID=933077 RepID=A0A086QEM0_TOXGO|nr:hypothetical protein TGVAND_435830 [Toxoplasma gondii VAND]
MQPVWVKTEKDSVEIQRVSPAVLRRYREQLVHQLALLVSSPRLSEETMAVLSEDREGGEILREEAGKKKDLSRTTWNKLAAQVLSDGDACGGEEERKEEERKEEERGEEKEEREEEREDEGEERKERREREVIEKDRSEKDALTPARRIQISLRRTAAAGLPVPLLRTFSVEKETVVTQSAFH